MDIYGTLSSTDDPLAGESLAPLAFTVGSRSHEIHCAASMQHSAELSSGDRTPPSKTNGRFLSLSSFHFITEDLSPRVALSADLLTDREYETGLPDVKGSFIFWTPEKIRYIREFF